MCVSFASASTISRTTNSLSDGQPRETCSPKQQCKLARMGPSSPPPSREKLFYCALLIVVPPVVVHGRFHTSTTGKYDTTGIPETSWPLSSLGHLPLPVHLFIFNSWTVFSPLSPCHVKSRREDISNLEFSPRPCVVNVTSPFRTCNSRAKKSYVKDSGKDVKKDLLISIVSNLYILEKV